MNPDTYLRYNKDQLYCFLDSETCNVNLAWLENKPWQWAWIIATKDRIISRRNIYVNWPVLNVSKKAAEITRFDHEKVKRLGISPEEACEEVDGVIYNPEYKLVGHNILGFDMYIHNIHRLNVGKPTDYSYLPRVLDTNYLAKGYKMGMQPRQGENLLVYQMRLVNIYAKGIKTSLETLCREFEIPHSPNAHDAEA